LREIAKEKWIEDELKKLGYNDEEIKMFQETIRCPRCGQPFLSFPYGWGWMSHLSKCKRKNKSPLF